MQSAMRSASSMEVPALSSNIALAGGRLGAITPCSTSGPCTQCLQSLPFGHWTPITKVLPTTPSHASSKYALTAADVRARTVQVACVLASR
jgi:hypothetical protein